MWYDKDEDVLNIQLANEEYWKSLELNGLIIDISKKGEIIGIEVLKASKVFLGDAKRVIQLAKQNHKMME